MQKISFDSCGYKLSGHLFVAENPEPLAFLFIQGWTGHQNLGAAKALADLGFTSMTYDMRGHGESEGDLAQFSRADFAADAETAYDYLKAQLPADARIGVVGSSFGSYTAVLLAERRQVACLSLRVAANYPYEGFNDPQLPQVKRERSADWRKKPLHHTDNHALTVLHNFTGAVQIVEADQDEVVDRQTLQNYANAMADKVKLEYVLLRDAPHTLADDRLRAEYTALLTKWVKKIAVE